MEPEDQRPDGDLSPEEMEARIKAREQRMAKIQAKLGQAEEYERIERREKIASGAKLAALAVVGLLLIAGGAWGVGQMASLAPGNECKFHEHASFRVFDEGRELFFQHPRFDMRNMAMRAHLHQPNDWQIHLEGGCADVQYFFGLMGMKIDPGYLRLDTELHGGKVLENDGNKTLRFFLYHNVDGNWTWQEYPELLGHQLREQQRMLVTYGNLTQEDIAHQQLRVPAVPVRPGG